MRFRDVQILGLTSLALIANLVISPPASSVEIAPFTTLFAANTNGAFAVTGNTNQTCSISEGPNQATCLAARNFAGNPSDFNNESHVMRDYSVGMAGIEGKDLFNSSSNQLEVPVSAKILKAYLFWFGTLETPTPADFGVAPLDESMRDKVIFAGPGQDCSGTKIVDCLVDGRSTTESLGANQFGYYSAYSDVTARVSETQNSWATLGDKQHPVFSVGNIQGAQGVGTASGWSLVLVYQHPDEALRHLELQSGFAFIAARSPQNFEFANFDAPNRGDTEATIGVIGADGDAGTAGESLTVRSGSISTVATNAVNPANNLMNSSISTSGVRSPYLSGTDVGRSKNTFGVDADLLTVPNALEPGATSARMTLSTTADNFYVSAIAFASTLGKSQLKLTKYIAKITQGGSGDTQSVTAGDELEYQIDIDNVGSGVATDVSLRDVFDSVHLDSVHSSDPRCAVVASTLKCLNLGDQSPSDPPIQIRITATVKNGTGKFDNHATATYGGHQGKSTAVSNVVTTEYAKLPVDLGLDLSFNHPYVQAGAAAHLQARITNYGIAADTNPVISFTSPSQWLLPGALPTGCRQVGRTINCFAESLGISAANPLRPGQSATVSIHLGIPSKPSRYQISASVETGASDGDPDLTNNFAHASIGINHPPAALPILLVAKVGGPAVNANAMSFLSDPDHDSLQIQIGTLPAQVGKLKLVGTRIIFTPSETWLGATSVAYFVSDGRGGQAHSTITIRVTSTGNQTSHNCRGFVSTGC